MSKRFLVMAFALALVLWFAFVNLQAQGSSIFHVFFWLLGVLLVAGVALWPSSGRDQRAELQLERLGWADRVEFNTPSATSTTNIASSVVNPRASHAA